MLVHGVRMFQYNLGILYARGIGVQKNDAGGLQMVLACGRSGRQGSGNKAR